MAWLRRGGDAPPARNLRQPLFIPNSQFPIPNYLPKSCTQYITPPWFSAQTPMAP